MMKLPWSKNQVDDLLESCARAREEGVWFEDCAEAKGILEADDAGKARIIFVAIERWRRFSGDNSKHVESGTEMLTTAKVISALLKSKPELSGADWLAIVSAAAEIKRENRWRNRFPFKALVAAIERAHSKCNSEEQANLAKAAHVLKNALIPRRLTAREQQDANVVRGRILANGDGNRDSQQIWRDFARLRELKSISEPRGEEKTLVNRLDHLVSGGSSPNLEPTDAVAAAVSEDLKSSGLAFGKEWNTLLSHAQQLKSTKPTVKWTAIAQRFVESVGRDAFRARATHWFEQTGKPAAATRLGAYNHRIEPTLLNNTTSDLLKGLCWTCAAVADGKLATPLGRLADSSYKKVKGVGPRAPKVGNAAVGALAMLPPNEAAAALSALRVSVKHPSSRAVIEKSLALLSQRTGLSPDALEERSASDFGLSEEEALRLQFGSFIAELRIAGTDTVQVRWISKNGKMQKSVPAEIKKEQPERVRRLHHTAKDIERALAAQRNRLERLFLSRTYWALADWRRYYIDHPLVGVLARKLIWRFQTGDQTRSAAFLDGRILDSSDQEISLDSANTRVTLWHPIHDTAEAVLAWRTWLERHEITQPFKQAHREIYILTEAELLTGTYSNRFAAHVIRQHQFAALAQQRGWRYRLQGRFDSHNVPFIDLPAWNTRVEFWVEAPENGETSEASIFLHLATDQVRFCRLDGTPCRLLDIEPVLFSELMRDVDLFVGVASIGNDPEWQDRGEARYAGYWQRYSFGDLGESAKTRREVLQRLIPRLKIADHCSFSDKFLIVRGQKRTYKIHLGSGNILMEPNEQYLCIVPDSRARAQNDNVFLPFEGDNTLSIILSKALLLAEDTKIKDPTITRQIER